jgi:hypothetical protein
MERFLSGLSDACLTRAQLTEVLCCARNSVGIELLLRPAARQCVCVCVSVRVCSEPCVL